MACSTEAEDLEELKEAVKDAVRCHFEKEKMPHVIRLHLAKDEVLALSDLPRNVTLPTQNHASTHNSLEDHFTDRYGQ